MIVGVSGMSGTGGGQENETHGRGFPFKAQGFPDSQVDKDTPVVGS